MRRSPIVLAVVAVLAAVVLAGPAGGQRKKVINIAAKEPDSLDPHGSTIGQSQAISRFMYRGLTRFAIKDGKVTTAEVVTFSFERQIKRAPGTRFGGTNFAHYRGIDDLLVAGRQERDPRKRAAIYHETQRRIMRDANYPELLRVLN